MTRMVDAGSGARLEDVLVTRLKVFPDRFIDKHRCTFANESQVV